MTNAGHFTIKKFEFDFVIFVRLNWGNREGELEAKDPEFYVMAANKARGLVKDPDRWAYIPYSKRTFDPHRSQWGPIKNFLKMPQGRKTVQVK